MELYIIRQLGPVYPLWVKVTTATTALLLELSLQAKTAPGLNKIVCLRLPSVAAHVRLRFTGRVRSLLPRRMARCVRACGVCGVCGVCACVRSSYDFDARLQRCW